MDKVTITKASSALVARFADVVARHPGLVKRNTFGNPAAYVGGNMACGLYGEGWFLRLPPAAADELLAIEGARPFSPMPGRAMKGYVMLPDAIIADDAALEPWLARAIEHAAAMPAK